MEISDISKTRMREVVLDAFKRGCHVYEMSAGVWEVVFAFRPAQTMAVGDDIVFLEEVDELKDFCKENGLDCVYDAGEYVLRFTKARL